MFNVKIVARCFYSLNSLKSKKFNYFSLTLDVHVGKNNPRLRRAKEVKIKEHFKHPKYNGRSFYYDIAAIILDEVGQ